MTDLDELERKWARRYQECGAVIDLLTRRINTLQAENERLRALVEDAYCEGYQDRLYTGEALDLLWRDSNSRAALQPQGDNQ